MKSLYEKFEGLGCDCEFGFVQRNWEIENLGLLKWGSMSHENTLKFLISFKDNDSPFLLENSELVLQNSGEYWYKNTIYNYVTHTWKWEDGSITNDDKYKLLIDTTNRINFLHRKLIDNLLTGNKLFLYKWYKAEMLPVKFAQAMEFINVLKTFNAKNKLAIISLGELCNSDTTKITDDLLIQAIPEYYKNGDQKTINMDFWNAAIQKIHDTLA
jgi:hypothetical protein